VDPIDRTKNYVEIRPNTRFINAFVSDTSVGQESFIRVQGNNGWEDQMSASKTQFIDDGHYYKYDEIMVDRISLTSLQAQLPDGIGVLLIDVEGFELKILQSLSDNIRPHMIIAENAAGIKQQKILHTAMQKKGYNLIGRIWTSDDIYIDQSRV
jgi:FkbM family methyltransferase